MFVIPGEHRMPPRGAIEDFHNRKTLSWRQPIPWQEKATSAFHMLARAKEVTSNRKLGPVAATYVSQVSCPSECPWYDDGKLGSPCYANNGFQGFMTAKLNQGKGDHLDAAHAEAELIVQLSGVRPLRLHIVGDCKDATAAKLVAKAADGYRAKCGQPVWTYTRAWEHVPRDAWGKVSVLASCETMGQVRRALRKGYATAVVVGKFARSTAYRKDGVKIVPCPQETGRVETCVECRLCLKDDLLRRAGITIGFEAHSGGAAKVREKLLQIEAAQSMAAGSAR
jgi:hypothetical protein